MPVNKVDSYEFFKQSVGNAESNQQISFEVRRS